jgi:hypothetical protein
LFNHGIIRQRGKDTLPAGALPNRKAENTFFTGCSDRGVGGSINYLILTELAVKLQTDSTDTVGER